MLRITGDTRRESVLCAMCSVHTVKLLEVNHILIRRANIMKFNAIPVTLVFIRFAACIAHEASRQLLPVGVVVVDGPPRMSFRYIAEREK